MSKLSSPQAEGIRLPLRESTNDSSNLHPSGSWSTLRETQYLDNHSVIPISPSETAFDQISAWPFPLPPQATPLSDPLPLTPPRRSSSDTIDTSPFSIHFPHQLEPIIESRSRSISLLTRSRSNLHHLRYPWNCSNLSISHVAPHSQPPKLQTQSSSSLDAQKSSRRHRPIFFDSLFPYSFHPSIRLPFNCHRKHESYSSHHTSLKTTRFSLAGSHLRGPHSSDRPFSPPPNSRIQTPTPSANASFGTRATVEYGLPPPQRTGWWHLLYPCRTRSEARELRQFTSLPRNDIAKEENRTAIGGCLRAPWSENMRLGRERRVKKKRIEEKRRVDGGERSGRDGAVGRAGNRGEEKSRLTHDTGDGSLVAEDRLARMRVYRTRKRELEKAAFNAEAGWNSKSMTEAESGRSRKRKKTGGKRICLCHGKDEEEEDDDVVGANTTRAGSPRTSSLAHPVSIRKVGGPRSETGDEVA